MSTTPTQPFQRIEETRYGDSQHDEVTTERAGMPADERARYGGPQHDADWWHPDEVHRLAYEDGHWRERRTAGSDQSADSGPTSGIDSTAVKNRPRTEPSRNPDTSATLA